MKLLAASVGAVDMGAGAMEGELVADGSAEVTADGAADSTAEVSPPSVSFEDSVCFFSPPAAPAVVALLLLLLPSFLCLAPRRLGGAM